MSRDLSILKDDKGSSVRITGFDCFNLKSTLYCGQAFRWKHVDGIEEAVVRGRLLRLEQVEDTIIIHPPVDDTTIDIVVDYLRLCDNHSYIENELKGIDEIMAKAVSYSSGLRLLRQDPFECLISYIISANNSIPLISRAVNLLSERFGSKIEFNCREYYTFPSPKDMENATEEGIFACKTGFRAPYIHKAVERITSGDIDLASIADMEYMSAKKELLGVLGVGDKVADCVLLFSMDKLSAFPVDVWVDRIVRNLYFDGKKMSKKEVRQWGENKFGKLSGYAQEYLFTYAREVRPEVLSK